MSDTEARLLIERLERDLHEATDLDEIRAIEREIALIESQWENAR